MAGRLKGRVAIITGAGTGMGETHARRFAKEGASVVLAEIDLPSAEKVAGEIKVAGGKALAVKIDVSKKADVDRMVQKTLDAYKRIDILVNNAAVFIAAPTVELTEADWQKNIDVNLKGVFLCCQAVGRQMLKQKYGKIINIASVSGHRGEPGQAGYCPSKAGVIGLTKMLAVEWAEHGINVNSVSPSTTLTPMCLKWLDDMGASVEDNAKWIPLKKANEPEDITNAVLFLASEESNKVTGQDIIVDGGITAVYWPNPG